MVTVSGEDPEDPGGPGESRRIKAFKWFCDYFNVPVEEDRLLTCKGMPKLLDGIRHPLSYQPDWSNTWRVRLFPLWRLLEGGSISSVMGLTPWWIRLR